MEIEHLSNTVVSWLAMKSAFWPGYGSLNFRTRAYFRENGVMHNRPGLCNIIAIGCMGAVPSKLILAVALVDHAFGYTMMTTNP